MKKNILKAARTLCLSAAALTIVPALATMVAIVSCNKDEDKNDGGTYSVTDKDDPKTLLSDAAKGVTKITITSTGTETEKVNGTDYTFTYKQVRQIDSIGKKHSKVEEYTLNGKTAVGEAYLYDGNTNTRYEYELDFWDNPSSFPDGEKTYCRGTMSSSDMYRFSIREYLPSYSSRGMEVKDGKLVQTYTYENCYTQTTEISFNADKRVKQVKYTMKVTAGSTCGYSDRESVETYTYDAAPALPSGYNDLSKYNSTCNNY